VHPQLAVHRAIVVVDVERFGDPERTNLNQLAVRDGLYKALIQAFGWSGISWESCVSEDRGDGALILVPPEIPKAYLVTRLPGMLAAAVSRHNTGRARPEQMRLRVALHAGEVYRDAHGVAGSAVNHAFRVAEAPALRSVLAASPAVLAVIVSDWLFNEVIRHDPAAEPGSYRKVQVTVKETAAVGWIRTPEPGTVQADAGQDHVLPLPDGTAASLRDSRRLAAAGLFRGGAAMDSPVPGLITADGAASVRRPIPAQLPHDVAEFTGRELELAALESVAVGQGGAAVVISAIDGIAGVGKTALAVHFAHRVAAGFPDGQLFVNLRGFDPDQPPLAPADVLAGFVRALGAGSSPAPRDLDELAAMYRSLLSGRRVLVVLDNAASAGQVRPLLPGTVGCLAIVTSRNTLSGLTARDGARRVTLDLLPPGDSVALLARVAGTERTAANPAAAGKLAQLCGRLPLALRITADRAASHRHLSMTDLVDELTLEHDRLDALAADEKTTQVRAVFSWSYQALEPGPARAFRLLSLHPGPDISTPAAAALIDAPIPATRQLVRTLAGGHLLEETGRDRYQFHDLVRVYATECAQASEPEPHRTAAIHRLLTWYMHTADAFSHTMNPDMRHVPLDPPPPSCTPLVFTTPRQALDWAESEVASLIPVLRQAAAVADDALAWKLPTTLVPILGWLHQFGFLSEDGDLVLALDAALAAARQLSDRAAEAHILLELAEIHCYTRPVQATEFCQRALAMSAETGDLYGQWGARYLEGISYLSLKRLREALDCLQQALATARQISDIRAQGMSLVWLGAVHEQLGSVDEVINLLGRAAALLERTGNRWQYAFAIQRLAEACHRHNRIDDAPGHYRQAQAIFHEIGDRLTEAIVLMELGQAQRDLGETDAARQCWEVALSIFEDLRDTRAEQVRSQLNDLSVRGIGKTR
jgi:tetratricopeptide (TPR) repeat protein